MAMHVYIQDRVCIMLSMIESESEDEEITASDEEFLESEIQGNLRTYFIWRNDSRNGI